jgi:CRISPR-associated endonuclease/helicase Cas3
MWDSVLSSWARGRIAAALELEEQHARAWVVVCAALHDLGKCSPPFQGQHDVAWERVAATGLRIPVDAKPAKQVPHGTVSTVVLAGLLPQMFGVPCDVAQVIATAIGGHHGSFPTDQDEDNVSRSDRGRARWPELRSALVELVAGCFSLPPSAVPQAIDPAAAMWLAGLTSVADWIGSNEEFFPYAVGSAGEETSLNHQTYLERARAQARDALQRVGWTGWTPKTEQVSFAEMFGFPENPMQQTVIESAEIIDGPGLTLIEAPMGQGKTEAAQWIADRSALELGLAGCYVALPTQATSNQMFGRFQQFLEKRYPDQVVNLQLLHGAASLSSELDDLKQRGAELLDMRNVYGNDELGSPAGVVAAEWFTYRKRGLLAPFGVGTVDQALLAILQIRHVFVRLFGLAHTVVIIDEVHAYDTYMSTLLERLLEWLAALASPVVLLSATLPEARRQALCQAYGRGLRSASRDAPKASYPRITQVRRSGEIHAIFIPVEQADEPIHLRWGEDGVQLADQLHNALRNGGCAVVICNTVARAQATYSLLRDYFESCEGPTWVELDLLHARYPFEERDRRERSALARFSKPGDTTGDAHRPRRAILVSTQIIEQSLDLDFDLMVTDLAPADLVLQRAGRLHRHHRQRPGGLEDRTLWIVGPQVSDEGVPTFDSGSAHVYDPHVLLRSWLALRDRSCIEIPGSVQDLIEAVYDDRPCPEELSQAVRNRWAETAEMLRSGREGSKQNAQGRDLRPPWFDEAIWKFVQAPLSEDAPELHTANQALTREGDPSVPVVLLDEAAGSRHTKSTPTISEAAALLRRSVTLSHQGVVRHLLESDGPSAWAKSPLLRLHRPLILSDLGEARVGSFLIRLDPELGITIDKESA